MSNKNKKQSLNLETKVKILQELNLNTTNRASLAEKYNVCNATLSNIVKNEERILSNICGHNKKMYKMRKLKYDDVDDTLYKYFVQCRDNKIPVDGNILKEKALEIAVLAGHNDFKASNGWFSKFSKRHNLMYKNLSGESASVSTETVNDWMENVLPGIISEYRMEDVFNLDETGLFYKCLPDRTLALKGVQCFNGKKSKERLTVLLGVNASGSEKLKILVIGKYLKPRCFKNVVSLPIDYKANSSAWMTSQIFLDYVKKYDQKFIAEKRNVLFIMDHCPCHPKKELAELTAIRVVFLPPNCTSKLQPLDLGIIQNFKVQYRKKIIKELLKLINATVGNINGNSTDGFSINIRDSIDFMYDVWINHVTASTIRNCFRKGGFTMFKDKFNKCDQLQNENISDIVSKEVNNEWEILKSKAHDKIDVDLNTYINIDDDLPTVGLLSVKELYEENLNVFEENPEISNLPVDCELICPSPEEMALTVATLNKFMLTNENISDDLWKALSVIRNHFDAKNQ